MIVFPTIQSHNIDAGPILLGFLVVSSFACDPEFRTFIIQDLIMTKNRTLIRRGVKVFLNSTSQIRTSTYEKGG